MSIKIIGVNASPFVRKTRVYLAEKGIDYELEPLMPLNVPPEYKEKSPLGKIPCLEEDGFAIPDSSVICAYLEKTRPTPPLYPGEPRDYARALWYEEYADTALLNAGIPIFQERFIKKRMMQQEADEEKVKKTIDEDLPPFLDYLEKEIGDDEFLVANRFSIADIAVATCFVNFAHGGWTPDASRWPKLAAYLDRIHSRPSFKACIEEEKKAFGL